MRNGQSFLHDRKCGCDRRRPKIRYRLVAKTLIVVLTLYIAGTYVVMQDKLVRAQKAYDALMQDYSYANQETNELRDLAAAEINDEYIIRMARIKLGYILPGEYVYIDVNGK
jgi:cell division protein FtsB